MVATASGTGAFDGLGSAGLLTLAFALVSRLGGDAGRAPVEADDRAVDRLVDEKPDAERAGFVPRGCRGDGGTTRAGPSSSVAGPKGMKRAAARSIVCGSGMTKAPSDSAGSGMQARTTSPTR